MKLTRTIGLVVLTVATGLNAAARADQSQQPRRAEVIHRLNNEDNRIRDGRRDGQLSTRQARHLRREDRAIRSEERADATLNGGHITKGEQRQLNQQENDLSRQIHRDR